MKGREKGSTSNCKNGHGFCCPVDRGTPSLTKDQQKDRESCSGMPYTDPPDKIDDCPSPSYRIIDTPGTNSFGHGNVDRIEPPDTGQCGNSHHAKPPLAGFGFSGSKDVCGDLVIGFFSMDQGPS